MILIPVTFVCDGQSAYSPCATKTRATIDLEWNENLDNDPESDTRPPTLTVTLPPGWTVGFFRHLCPSCSQ